MENIDNNSLFLFVYKPGQGIPPGLHVRIDMQTGKKEAKLLGDPDVQDRSSSSSALISTAPPEAALNEGLKLDHSEIKEALKKIKNEATESDISSDENFRTYEQIKEDMKDLNYDIKTEYEIMKDLVDNFVKQEDELARTSTLNDLEYYVHKFDNAVDFVKIGCFKSIVLPSLNATSADLRSAAAFLLGKIENSDIT